MENPFIHKPKTTGHEDSLGDKLKAIINELPPEEVTLHQVRDLLGQEGLLLLTAFLSMAFLIPVSPPGVSTVFGGAILLIAVCRLFNCCLWVPERLLTRKLSAEKLHVGLNKGLTWLRRLECISRSNRLECLTRGRWVSFANNSALVAAAVLLMAPFGFVPLSNTLPAVAILLFTIGSLQRDGLCMFFGHVVSVATVIYFGVLIGGGGVIFLEILQKIA